MAFRKGGEGFEEHAWTIPIETLWFSSITNIHAYLFDRTMWIYYVETTIEEMQARAILKIRLFSCMGVE